MDTSESIHPRVVNGRTAHPKVNTSAKPEITKDERLAKHRAKNPTGCTPKRRRRSR